MKMRHTERGGKVIPSLSSPPFLCLSFSLSLGEWGVRDVTCQVPGPDYLLPHLPLLYELAAGDTSPHKPQPTSHWLLWMSR